MIAFDVWWASEKEFEYVFDAKHFSKPKKIHRKCNESSDVKAEIAIKYMKSPFQTEREKKTFICF